VGIYDCYGVYDWLDGAGQRRDELKSMFDGVEVPIELYPLIEKDNNKGNIGDTIGDGIQCHSSCCLVR